MGGAGKEFTNPGIDLKDLHRHQFTTAPDGKLYQLPDQQFANLYWFRADLFDRKDMKDKFKAKYGYDLGVPLNWSAYEDIAEFFTNDVNIDGKAIYGHMDYGKKDPSLGWRFTDAWLSMAGHGRQRGAPNGCRSTNGASAWLTTSARPWAPGGPWRRHQLASRRLRPHQVRGLDEEVRAQGSHRHDLRRSRPVPAQGQIAQQIFWYTAFTADMTKPGLPVVNADGTPKWRMAPARTARTGSRACRTATRTWVRGLSSRTMTPTRPPPPGCTPSS